jgi:hypothetical protein
MMLCGPIIDKTRKEQKEARWNKKKKMPVTPDFVPWPAQERGFVYM